MSPKPFEAQRNQHQPPFPLCPCHCAGTFGENDGQSSCRVCRAQQTVCVCVWWGMEVAELYKKSYCRPVDQRRLNGLREKGQEVCVFTVICQPHGEESRRIKILVCHPGFVVHGPSFILWGLWWDRKVSHHWGPSPSAMSVIELEVHCLGIRSSEVKSFCLLHL